MHSPANGHHRFWFGCVSLIWPGFCIMTAAVYITLSTDCLSFCLGIVQVTLVWLYNQTLSFFFFLTVASFVFAWLFLQHVGNQETHPVSLSLSVSSAFSSQLHIVTEPSPKSARHLSKVLRLKTSINWWIFHCLICSFLLCCGCFLVLLNMHRPTLGCTHAKLRKFENGIFVSFASSFAPHQAIFENQRHLLCWVFAPSSWSLWCFCRFCRSAVSLCKVSYMQVCLCVGDQAYCNENSYCTGVMWSFASLPGNASTQ